MAYHRKERSPAAGRVLLVALAMAVLLLAQHVGRADAKMILYDVMQADEVPGRNRLTHEEDEANKYTRGCESSNKCRG